jgi:hypothetical protein
MSEFSFFLESDRTGAVVRSLPLSGIQIRTADAAALSGDDFVRADVGQNEFGKCLRLQLSRHGTVKLQQLAASAGGQRLVLVVDGHPVGALRLHGRPEDDYLCVLVEVPDADLPGLARELNASLAGRHPSMVRFGLFDPRP